MPTGSTEQHSPYGLIGTNFITTEAIEKNDYLINSAFDISQLLGIWRSPNTLTGFLSLVVLSCFCLFKAIAVSMKTSIIRLKVF